MIQIVDLAAKFSAGQLRDERSGEVLDQFDSRALTPYQFAAKIGSNARREDCVLTLIEDVPPNPAYTQAMTKPVTRLQGVIMAFSHAVIDDVLWVNPSTWMGMFPGVQRAPKELKLTKSQSDAYRIEEARKHAEARGYTPPDLTVEYLITVPPGKRPLRKHLEPLEKNMSDYVSAFLIGEWAIPIFQNEGRAAFDNIVGVQPSLI